MAMDPGMGVLALSAPTRADRPVLLHQNPEYLMDNTDLPITLTVVTVKARLTRAAV